MAFKGWENYDPTAPKKSPEMQRRGQINRIMGAQFEQYITAACDAYRTRGIADIEKTPEPFRVLSSMHRLSCGAMGFEGVFEEKAQPDFKGTMRNGISIVFEAKESSTGRIEQRAVNPHQTKSLRSHERLGAKAFVMVCLDFRDFYRVPWAVWDNMKELCGHKYMNREQLEPYRIHCVNGMLHLLENL